MNKKQLLKELENVNDNSEIIVSADSEGNSYNRLGFVSIEEGLKFYIEEGELNLIGKDDLNEEYGMTEKKYNKMKDCVVLYP